MEDSSQQPLLSSDNHHNYDHSLQSRSSNDTSFSAAFSPNSEDIPPITGSGVFCKEFYKEFIKLWLLAGPAIFTVVCQYGLGAITQIFLGHVDALSLAAYSIENNVLAGFTFGLTLGMGSALETLCGQAFGAGQLNMLGVYMQRSWVILAVTACILTPLYVFAGAILKLIGQNAVVSAAAGRLALYMIPQLFAFSLNFPMNKFLQSQSKMMVVAVIAAVTVVLHAVFSWLLVQKLKWGMAGAAAVLDATWWLTPLLVTCTIINTVQPILSGAAVGAGWQASVAYVNIGCYYVLGIPLGLILSFVLHLGVQGIWGGMLVGTTAQTFILFLMFYKTNWEKEASMAEDRIKK